MTAAGEDLAALQQRRRHDCRLTPDRALTTIDDAGAFLEDRGLLTRTPDSALPSLFEACHEEPYRPGGHGFAAWPRTRYWWAGALAERPDVLELKIHRGKNLLLAPRMVALAAPVCLAELARMREADPGWRRLLDHLAAAGPSTLEDVQLELGLKPRELRSLRAPLERCGALVSLPVEASARDGEGHVHTSRLARVDQVVPPELATGSGGDPAAGVADLVVAGVRAAAVAPEGEIRRWFSWSWYLAPDLAERLVREGRVRRPADGWLAARMDA